MTYLSIITAAAKAAGLSVTLLYSICAHESKDYTLDYAMYDNGSPSYSVCQVKLGTAEMFGFKGEPMELREPRIGAKYAALYLKYQITKYNGNICKAVSAYNSGTYTESPKNPGLPKNLRYIKLVKEKLPEEYKYLLNCENK